jgi:hypothetical protein
MAIEKDKKITADDINNLLMPKSGGTFTGSVSMGTYILTVPTLPIYLLYFPILYICCPYCSLNQPGNVGVGTLIVPVNV